MAKQWTPERGSPQGAVISPLLSNIYLDSLDHLMVFVSGVDGVVVAEVVIISVGQMVSLPNMGFSLLSRPMRWPVSPLRGEPPTGEPCAGDPHARFGGARGRGDNRFFLPLSGDLGC